MYCGNCGAQLTDGARFCPSCGRARTGADKLPAVPAPPPPARKSDAGSVVIGGVLILLAGWGLVSEFGRGRGSNVATDETRHYDFSVDASRGLALLADGKASEALAQLSRAADGGDGSALLALSTLHYSGFGVPQDDAESLRLAQAAYDAGFSRAAAAIAWHEWRRRGDREGTPEVVKILEGADRAAPHAADLLAFRLGWASWFGLGTPEDRVKARAYFERSADAGSFFALNMLGLYHSDNGSAGDAVRHWRAAADTAGMAAAQYSLYLAYRDGKGAPQDRQQAANWLIRSARQNDRSALAAMGYHFSRGDLFQQDRQLSLKWNLRAAMAGDAMGMFNVATIFDNDPGMVGAAYLFYNLSAAAGYERARAERDRLEQRLPAGVLAEIQAAARDFDRARTDLSEFELTATGTGFFVDIGTLATNEHVIGECARLVVRKGDQMLTDVTVLAANADTDLALLRVRPAPGGSYSAAIARLVPTLPALGETVTAYGYPLSGTLASSGTLSTGILSATAGVQDDPTRVQFSAPVQPGNSGGALLDSRGRVIAVVQAQLNPISQGSNMIIPQNVNFAVKASELQRLLEANGYRLLTAGADGPALSAQALAVNAQATTAQVLCYQNKLESQMGRR